MQCKNARRARWRLQTNADHDTPSVQYHSLNQMESGLLSSTLFQYHPAIEVSVVAAKHAPIYPIRGANRPSSSANPRLAPPPSVTESDSTRTRAVEIGMLNMLPRPRVQNKKPYMDMEAEGSSPAE